MIAQVEPANFCNLKCPLCLTTSITHSRPRALLSLEAFTRFMDQIGDRLLLLIFWNWGEPFLNPDLCKMITMAKSRGIIVHTSTNGNIPLDRAKAEDIVNSGLDSLVVAVDGARPETYQAYRKGGNLEQVLANIQTLVRTRNAMRRRTPRINMRFVVMRHNEHEIFEAQELARELGVDYFTLKTVDMPPDLGTDLDQAFVPDNQRYRRYEYKENSFIRKKKPFTCMRPWKRITMDASGEIIPCEFDYKNHHSFGNIMRMDVLDVWKSQIASDFRKGFNLGQNDYYLCRECSYKNNTYEDCIMECFTTGRDMP